MPQALAAICRNSSGSSKIFDYLNLRAKVSSLRTKNNIKQQKEKSEHSSCRKGREQQQKQRHMKTNSLFATRIFPMTDVVACWRCCNMRADALAAGDLICVIVVAATAIHTLAPLQPVAISRRQVELIRFAFGFADLQQTLCQFLPHFLLLLFLFFFLSYFCLAFYATLSCFSFNVFRAHLTFTVRLMFRSLSTCSCCCFCCCGNLHAFTVLSAFCRRFGRFSG